MNITRETPGPTSYAKRDIIEGKVTSAFSLMIDESMIRHIQKCTEAEARMEMKNDLLTNYLEE
jgi:hypothetical protein